MSFDIDIFKYDENNPQKFDLKEYSDSLYKTIKEGTRLPIIDEAVERMLASSHVIKHPINAGELADRHFGITIFPLRNLISLQLPYWYKGHELELAFVMLERIYEVINDCGNWYILDCQTGEIKTSILDKDSQKGYSSFKKKVEKTVSKNNKSWWQFWK